MHTEDESPKQEVPNETGDKPMSFGSLILNLAKVIGVTAITARGFDWSISTFAYLVLGVLGVFIITVVVIAIYQKK